MDAIRTLEALLKDVKGNEMMGRRNRMAHYLTAMASLAHAEARWQNAKFELEVCDELVEGCKNREMRRMLDNKREYAQYDLDLADLERQVIDRWVCTLSGAYWRKEVAGNAFKELGASIARKRSTLFPKAMANVPALSKKEAKALREKLKRMKPAKEADHAVAA